jgi:hypothetical protein
MKLSKADLAALRREIAAENKNLPLESHRHLRVNAEGVPEVRSGWRKLYENYLVAGIEWEAAYDAIPENLMERLRYHSDRNRAAQAALDKAQDALIGRKALAAARREGMRMLARIRARKAGWIK